jgi:hypothetical protein
MTFTRPSAHAVVSSPVPEPPSVRPGRGDTQDTVVTETERHCAQLAIEQARKLESAVEAAVARAGLSAGTRSAQNQHHHQPAVTAPDRSDVLAALFDMKMFAADLQRDVLRLTSHSRKVMAALEVRKETAERRKHEVAALQKEKAALEDELRVQRYADAEHSSAVALSARRGHTHGEVVARGSHHGLTRSPRSTSPAQRHTNPHDAFASSPVAREATLTKALSAQVDETTAIRAKLIDAEKLLQAARGDADQWQAQANERAQEVSALHETIRSLRDDVAAKDRQLAAAAGAAVASTRRSYPEAASHRNGVSDEEHSLTSSDDEGPAHTPKPTSFNPRRHDAAAQPVWQPTKTGGEMSTEDAHSKLMRDLHRLNSVFAAPR